MEIWYFRVVHLIFSRASINPLAPRWWLKMYLRPAAQQSSRKDISVVKDTNRIPSKQCLQPNLGGRARSKHDRPVCFELICVSMYFSRIIFSFRAIRVKFETRPRLQRVPLIVIRLWLKMFLSSQQGISQSDQGHFVFYSFCLCFFLSDC